MHVDEEHVAGDDPGLSQKLGLFDLTRNAYRVRVHYKGQYVYCELYLHPDGTREIHWMCPRCHGGGNGHMSRIPSTRKAIEFDAKRLTHMGGSLDVEPFTCPWELGEDRRMEFGLGMCGLTIAIDHSVAKDA